MNRKGFWCLAFSLSLGLFPAAAGVIEDAAAMIDGGDYAAAKEILLNFASTAKGAQLGKANALIGECLIHLGLCEEAAPYADAAVGAKVAEGYLVRGKLDYLDYDFDRAGEMFGNYAAALKRSRKEDPDLDAERRRLERAQSALGNVEDIVVIDSIAVDRDSFFRTYKLPASAGRLTDASSMPLRGRDIEPADIVFHSENDDFVMWAQPDSIGVNVIAEASRLVDGSWNIELLDDGTLNGGGDAGYPFMMSDGATLYFASDGDESLGGLDIFKAVRDSSDGEFMQPQNLGMPYNSPWDDYMLAIDEENGVGWWATDRNRLGDKVTVYLFIVNDVRSNLDPEREDITDRARIADYRATWQEPDYSEILRMVADIKPGETPKEVDFLFPMRDGSMLTSWDDLKTRGAAQMMRDYLDMAAKLQAREEELLTLRNEYARTRKGSDAASLRSMEKSVEAMREKVKGLRNEVYRALGEK